MPHIDVFLVPGQSLSDLALERYGAIEGLVTLIQDNPQLTIGANPGNVPIKVRLDVPELTSSNQAVKAMFESKNWIINNESY